MTIRFVEDPAGAILELVRLGIDGNPRDLREWQEANAPTFPMPITQSVMNKGIVANLLLHGKRGEELARVRHQLDRIFRQLESEHLLQAWVGDHSNDTSYRMLSALGEELLDEDAHREYLGASVRSSAVRGLAS